MNSIHRKSLIGLLLVVAICLSLAVCAYATSPTTCVNVIEAKSETELFEQFEEISKNQTVSPQAAEIYVGLARNGNTEDCAVYLLWSGGSRYNGWRFKEAVFTNGSWINNVEYGTIGNGTDYKTFNVNSASTGSVQLGNINVSTDVSKVHVTFDSLEGSLSANTKWRSVVLFGPWASIN